MTRLTKHRRHRKSRKHPEPHFSRCDSFGPHDIVHGANNHGSSAFLHCESTHRIEHVVTNDSAAARTFIPSSFHPERSQERPFSEPIQPPLQVEEQEDSQHDRDSTDNSDGGELDHCSGTSAELEFGHTLPDAFDYFRTTALSDDDASSRLSADNFSSPSTSIRNISEGSMHEARTLCQEIKKFMTRPTLLGILSLYGKPRLTLASYDHLVALMKDGDSGTHLPCAT